MEVIYKSISDSIERAITLAAERNLEIERIELNEHEFELFEAEVYPAIGQRTETEAVCFYWLGIPVVGPKQ